MIIGFHHFRVAFALIISTSIQFTTASLEDNIEFSFNDVSLPFPISDTTSNYMEGELGDEDGFIIITGGCDSEKGNERIEQHLFACSSTSNKTLKFDPYANSFMEMAEMPNQRQRHASAVIDGKLYVVGGRDSLDNIVPQIDSFDPRTNKWTMIGNLPEAFLTSDLTAWSWNNYMYVTGGFVQNYTAVGTTFRIDPIKLGEKELGDGLIEDYDVLKESPNPRGDFHAVTLYGYAYLAGGITHSNYWCVGLKTTERYHMATDTWETLSDLNVGRADMAVAIMNGKILAVGGEEKPPEACLDDGDPAFASLPTNHVDALLLGPDSQSSPEWVEVSKFEDGRFRFSAAVTPSLNRMYTFGGQLPFDSQCDCFPTSKHVGVGQEVLKENSGSYKKENFLRTTTLFFVATFLILKYF